MKKVVFIANFFVVLAGAFGFAKFFGFMDSVNLLWFSFSYAFLGFLIPAVAAYFHLQLSPVDYFGKSEEAYRDFIELWIKYTYVLNTIVTIWVMIKTA